MKEPRFDLAPVTVAGVNKTAKAVNPEFTKLSAGMRKFITSNLVILDAPATPDEP